MISYRLLREIMPITEEENKILHSGVIDRNLYMSGGTDVVNSKLLFLSSNARRRCGVIADSSWFKEIENYEKEVLANR